MDRSSGTSVGTSRRIGRVKVPALIGLIIGLAAGLLGAPPAAHASVLQAPVWLVSSDPSPFPNQNARAGGVRLTTGYPYGDRVIQGRTTFRASWVVGAGSTATSYRLKVWRCEGTSTTCVQVRQAGRSGVDLVGPTNIDFSQSVTIFSEDVGNKYFAELEVTSSTGETETSRSFRYFSTVEQPVISESPTMQTTAGGGAAAANEVDVTSLGDYQARYGPVTVAEPDLGLTRQSTVYICDDANAGQNSEWEMNVPCPTLASERSANNGPFAIGLEPYSEAVSQSVGKYLLLRDVVFNASNSAGGAAVKVRSATYPIVESTSVAQPTQQPQQAAPQQQGQQQDSAPQQQSTQQPEQAASQQAGQQAAANVPTGAAALRLQYGQAPLAGVNGTGVVDGTVLTVKSPAVQKRGKKKKAYQAVVDPRYRGRVAFVLTRTTPKGQMIVAKSKVKQTGKNGKAKIRWKFAKKKPAGTYTLYVSFIPKARYGKPGLTVSKPLILR